MADISFIVTNFKFFFCFQTVTFFIIFFMNIYIGNLNYRVREDDLRRALEEYGTVDSVRVIKDRDTGRSKGYAFAELPNDDEAQNAIRGLNEVELQGRQMVVKEALPKR